MSLWDKLPADIIQNIYDYDSTYKDKMNESLKFIKYACPTCCCDGGKKTRYRHYSELDDFWNWEWRRRNACPKHNPEDFDKDGNQIEYNWRADTEYYIPNYVIPLRTHYVPDIIIFNPIQNIVIHGEIRMSYGNIYNGINRTIDYNIIMLSLWMFCTRNKDIYPSPIKTYSRKKLIGSRFMDMAHEQRRIKA